MPSPSRLIASFPFALSLLTPLVAQAQWQTLPHTPPYVAAMAWDGGLDAPVMLGGDPYANVYQHLWGPGGRFSALPAPMAEPSMAYDATRDVLVVLGQVAGTWTIFEGRAQWTTIAAPWANGSNTAAIVYDPTRATNVIACQGGSQLRFFDWNGTTAVPRLQVSRPSTPMLQLVHHAAQGRVWVIEAVGGTWNVAAYDGTTLQPLGGSPPTASYMRCAYDAVGSRLLAFGGYNGITISPATVNQATWAYDGSSWTSLGTSVTQPGVGHACTSAQGQVHAHATVLRRAGSTWIPRPALHTWGGSSWSIVPGSESPATLRHNDGVGDTQLDPIAGRTLVGLFYGTYNTAGYTTNVWYEWDGAHFTPVAAPPSLCRLIGFHEGVGRHVAFGYVAGQPRTYHRVNGSWSLVTTSGPPAGPFWGWAWDGTDVILFGSRVVASGLLPETWAWNGLQWSQRTPAHSPTPRFDPRMVFDASRRRVVLFGGSLWGQPLADTWEWDGVDWTQCAQGPTVDPFRTDLLWHGKRARAVLHERVGLVENVWEWNGTVWQPQLVGGSALAADGAGLIPSPDGDLLRIGVGVDRYGSAFPASYASIGAGCAGSAGVPTLSTALHDQPWLGDWITVRVRALPASAGAVFLLTGFSTTSWSGVPLPLALAPLGAGPCTLHVAADLTIPLLTGNGEAEWGTAIPWEPSLLGFELHQQALVPDPAANAFGWTLSNAATLRIGRR